MPAVPQLARFGLFEVDLNEGTLLKNGRKIRLQDQPFRLFVMLLEHPGQAVTRDKLKEALWPADTFVDFDHSLNAAAFPHISSDGSWITADTTRPGESNGIRLVERRNLAWRRIPGATAWDWSHDNKRLLYDTEDDAIRCLNIASGKDVFQLAYPKHYLFQAKFAPGDRFVAVEAVDQRGYGVNSLLFVVPFRENTQVAAKDWIPINHSDGVWDDKPRWSPDGNLLYFVSNRDGHLCLWAQRLDAKSKRPIGTSFPVRHFHNAGFGMQNIGVGLLGIDVARDKVVFGLGELTGNIWSVRLP